MLDSLLANEILPEEYRNRWQVPFASGYRKILVKMLHFDSPIYPHFFFLFLFLFSFLKSILFSFKSISLFLTIQDILCNDCEKKGSARFHWLYHKCGFCGSYNTRVIKVTSPNDGCTAPMQ